MPSPGHRPLRSHAVYAAGLLYDLDRDITSSCV